MAATGSRDQRRLSGLKSTTVKQEGNTKEVEKDDTEIEFLRDDTSCLEQRNEEIRNCVRLSQVSGAT
jgi:hypothetical protein